MAEVLTQLHSMNLPMTRLITLFISVTILILSGQAISWACDEPGRGVYVKPLMSNLKINENPELCELFLQATATLKSIGGSRYWREFEQHFPGSSVIKSGFGPKMYFTVDYDSDGIDEIFYFEYEDSSTRPGLKFVFLYETQSDLEEDEESGVITGMPQKNRTGSLDIKNSKAKFLGGFVQSELIHIFHLGGKIYAQDGWGLHILEPGFEKRLVCAL